MNIRKISFTAAVLSAIAFAASTAPVASAAGGCPYGYDKGAGKPMRNLRERKLTTAVSFSDIKNDQQMSSESELPIADFAAVKKDIVRLLTDSKDWWPADFGNYGPFFIRLAWHCAGTYRLSDGRGGCDGARIRHLPERAWSDNTNLDKALDLLAPLKLKYGPSLSWGDLIALTGTTAIESMGGPQIGFCGGRIDDEDGAESVELDPALAQAEVAHCDENGKCTWPLGTTTSGLIYVNPEGPNGVPDPVGSALEIRDTFGRMGFTDRETVALIGGGHGFGKMHGACMTGPGPNPIEAPDAPWPGTCNSNPDSPMGKDNNTYTSGFEHPWVFHPVNWTNEYFQALRDVPLVQDRSPGGRVTWKADPDTVPPLRMLTVDVALIKDEIYKPITVEFANNISALADAFGPAWYKLMTMDMGPATRCKGNLVPTTPTAHQNPLPPAPAQLPDFNAVAQRIQELLTKDLPGLTSDKVDNTKSYNGALFVHLAYQCAATFRITDYAGGCNGAKIRFSPQKDWEGNAGMDSVIAALEPIKKDFPTLFTADLIVLAGQVALEQAGSDAIAFIGGRVDATDGENVAHLAPRTYYKNPLVAVRDDAKVRGLTPREYVALAGRPRSLVQQQRLGYGGTFTTNIARVSNEFYKVLLSHVWTPVASRDGRWQYKAQDAELYVLDTDVALLWDSTYKAVVQEYASDETIFKQEFAHAWAMLMAADHFSTQAGYY